MYQIPLGSSQYYGIPAKVREELEIRNLTNSWKYSVIGPERPGKGSYHYPLNMAPMTQGFFQQHQFSEGFAYVAGHPYPYGHQQYPTCAWSAATQKKIRETTRPIQPSFSLKLLMDTFARHDASIMSLDFEGNLERGLPTQVGLTFWPMNYSCSSRTRTELYMISEASDEPNFIPKQVECPQYRAGMAPTGDEFLPAQATSLETVTARINSIFASQRTNPNFILVLHGGSCDLKCLKLMNVDLNGIKVLDTQTLQAELNKLSTIKWSLEHCLKHFGVSGQNFHNAANDSYYTMQLFWKLGEKVGNLRKEGGKVWI